MTIASFPIVVWPFSSLSTGLDGRGLQHSTVLLYMGWFVRSPCVLTFVSFPSHFILLKSSPCPDRYRSLRFCGWWYLLGWAWRYRWYCNWIIVEERLMPSTSTLLPVRLWVSGADLLTCCCWVYGTSTVSFFACSTSRVEKWSRLGLTISFSSTYLLPPAGEKNDKRVVSSLRKNRLDYSAVSVLVVVGQKQSAKLRALKYCSLV